MHTSLPQQIAQLSSNISGDDAQADMLKLAKHCQVENENHYLLEMLSGELQNAVAAAFGPLSLLLVLAEPKRRQVHFAVLAKMESLGTFSEERLDPAMQAELLARMLTAPSEALIEGAYGSCPKGFLALLTCFGDRARRPDIYLKLHRILSKNPSLAPHLRNASRPRKISDDIIDIMDELPPTRLSVRFAEALGTEGAYRSFINAYAALTGSHVMSDAHMQRVVNDGNNIDLIAELYQQVPFPEPVIKAEGIEHIADGNALKKAAVEFDNDIERQIPTAIRGENQYYIWRPNGAPAVLFSIFNEGSLGWRLDRYELKTKKRFEINSDVGLHNIVIPLGVKTGEPIEELMRSCIGLGTYGFID